VATRFYEEAQQQLNPIYQQQQTAIESQVPAIQNLYQTLIQGLQSSSQQQLNSGTQNIVEDASRRGVLRSTLPVDARQSLQGQISQALLQGQGQLASQQAQDIAGVNEKLGTLGIQRTGAIADLARSLETQDLERQKFIQAQAEADRNYQLEQQKLEIARQSARSSGGSGRAPTAAENTQMAASALARELQGVAGRDGYVSPQDYAAGRREWVAAGFSSKSYDDYFAGYKNPRNQNYQYY
jgi:hypothetical protein